MICLIVDKSLVDRRVGRSMMEGQGFIVVEAADGCEAMWRCADIVPDVIVLDNQMPIMDGLTFLTWLRQAPVGKQPLVLFCTTSAHSDVIASALVAGADGVLVKPFEADAFFAKLREIEALPAQRAA
ncbi:response regulator [Methylobacterium komagatae]